MTDAEFRRLRANAFAAVRLTREARRAYEAALAEYMVAPSAAAAERATILFDRLRAQEALQREPCEAYRDACLAAMSRAYGVSGE